MATHIYCSNETKIINVDFGEVEIGRRVTKSIEIINESPKEQIYEARRDPTTNPLDYVFNLKSYIWSLMPKETFKCEIYFQPFTSSTKNVDYFNIAGNDFQNIKIIAFGSSIGPRVSSSVNRINMIAPKKNSEVKKRIKLTNHSNTKAIFMFDFDKKQESFKLNMTHGCINPNAYEYIIVSFVPLELKVYVYNLICLILNQNPIVIELYGYCETRCHKINVLDQNIHFSKIENNFEGYMSDIIYTSKDCKHLLSLSKNYFDYDQVDVGLNKSTQSIFQTVCFTNHSQKNAFVKWEKDAEGIFTIIPNAAEIYSNQSALFEINFNPDQICKFYTRELSCYLFYDEPDEIKEVQDIDKYYKCPLITSLRVIGHSFSKNSNGWIPQYHMPQVVILPPCVPPFPVYTTFVINKFGHLPLMFRFLPPSKSHFIVKPMLGVIYEDYQIIVIQMSPELESEKIYVEQWTICFNGNWKNKAYINFKGYAEYANVSFNNNNKIVFDCVYPGSQQMKRIFMRNITRHALIYTFLNIPPELNMQYTSGEINTNDTLSQKWLFCPAECGEYNFEVKCILKVFLSGLTLGSEICIFLKINGRSETGFLVATPNELHFHEQTYNDEKKKSFNVFNFSSVNIFYKMTYNCNNYLTEDKEHDIRIYPAFDTIFPGESKKIIVSVTSYMRGYFKFVIQYFMRINSQTDDIIPGLPPRNICKLYCICVFPTLKIIDLHYHGIISTINKVSLWKTMEVNALNSILNNIIPHEEKTQNIYFQPMIFSKEPLYIKLFVTNTTSVTSYWNLKRVQLCSCKYLTKTRGLSFRYMEYDCVHKEICSIYPRSGNLKAKEIKTIVIELRYILVGKTEVKWDLNIGHERHIFVSMHIECLSGIERELHILHGTYPKLHDECFSNEEPLQSTCLKLHSVCFSNEEPLRQVFWICNNTQHSLSYSVDITNLYKINKIHYSEIFSCLTSRAIVEPLRYAPFILKFQPKLSGIFEVTIPITLGVNKTEIMLKGESYFKCLPKPAEVIPRSSIHKFEEVPAYFNRDYMKVSIAMHSRVIKMLLVYNTLKNEVLSYKWKRQEIVGILTVYVHPSKGIIQPRTIQTFRVIINTAGCPCNIDINIPCKFINVTQRRLYQRSILKYDIMCKELNEQFTITEKGIITSEKPPLNLKKKPEIYYKGLDIYCDIYNPDRKPYNITLKDELKSIPAREFHTENILQQKRKTENFNMASFILQGMIWDILNSEIFEYILQGDKHKHSHLFYSQFLMNLSERQKLIKRSNITAPRTLIATILEKMLFCIIHDEFMLKTSHFIEQKDIRHINYLHMHSMLAKLTVEEQDNKQDSLQHKYTKSTMEMKISFSE